MCLSDSFFFFLWGSSYFYLRRVYSEPFKPIQILLRPHCPSNGSKGGSQVTLPQCGCQGGWVSRTAAIVLKPACLFGFSLLNDEQSCFMPNVSFLKIFIMSCILIMYWAPSWIVHIMRSASTYTPFSLSDRLCLMLWELRPSVRTRCPLNVSSCTGWFVHTTSSH